VADGERQSLLASFADSVQITVPIGGFGEMPEGDFHLDSAGYVGG